MVSNIVAEFFVVTSANNDNPDFLPGFSLSALASFVIDNDAQATLQTSFFPLLFVFATYLVFFVVIQRIYNYLTVRLFCHLNNYSMMITKCTWPFSHF